VAATITTVYLVTLALADLLGRRVAPAELFEGTGKVSVPGGEVELRLLRSALSAEAPGRPRPASADAQRAWLENIRATWPKRLQEQPYGRFHKTKAAMVEADVRIAKSLGLDADRAAAEMAYMWNKPLSVERDTRAGPGANRQQRGQVTRALKEELRKVVADGDD
jgi:hypothetical protein